MLRKLLQKVRDNLDALETPSNPTAAKVRQLLPECSACGKKIVGHRFAQIATTILTQENATRVRGLYEHVERHEWSALRDFQDFEPQLDTVVVYAIKCSVEPGGMALLISDPHELYAAPEAYRVEVLSAAELATIFEFTSESDWKEL